MALKTRAFAQFERLAIKKILRDELHLARFIRLAALTRPHDRQKLPIHLVNRLFELPLQTSFPRLGMRGFDQIINSAKEIGAVS